MTNLDITLILYMVSVVAAFVAGMRYAEFKLIKKMMDMMTPDELEELEQVADKIKKDLERKGVKDVKVHQVDADDVVEVKHERVNGMHLFYDDSNRFLCQGATFAEVSKHMAELIGTKKVGVIKHEDGGTSLIIEG